MSRDASRPCTDRELHDRVLLVPTPISSERYRARNRRSPPTISSNISFSLKKEEANRLVPFQRFSSRPTSVTCKLFAATYALLPRAETHNRNRQIIPRRCAQSLDGVHFVSRASSCPGPGAFLLDVPTHPVESKIRLLPFSLKCCDSLSRLSLGQSNDKRISDPQGGGHSSTKFDVFSSGTSACEAIAWSAIERIKERAMRFYPRFFRMNREWAV